MKTQISRQKIRRIVEKINPKIRFGILFILTAIFIFLPIVFELKLKTFKTLGLLGIFIINFIGSATIFIPSPSIISVGIGGHLYNPFIVAVLASLGSSLGETVGFMFGYSSVKVLDINKKHKLLYHLRNAVLGKFGTLVILLFSLIPNPFFDSIGIIVGVSDYPFKKFLSIVFVGRLIRNILIAFIGAKL